MNPSRILTTCYNGFCIGTTVALGKSSMELLVNTLDLEPKKTDPPPGRANFSKNNHP